MKKNFVTISAVLLLLLAACTQTPGPGTSSSLSSSSAADVLMKDYLNNTSYPQDYWPVSTPEEQGISSSKLLSVLSNFYTRNHNIQSFLVIRNGVLVFERYGTDPSDVSNTVQGRLMQTGEQITPEFTHQWYSTTKSVVSSLVGIAIHDGVLTGTDQKVINFCGSLNVTNQDSRVSNISIRHLLEMTSGFSWDNSVESGALFSADMLNILMNRPFAGNPGEVWYYNNVSPSLLTYIIQQASGTNFLIYAHDKLLGPLGIATNSYSWMTDMNGLAYGGFGIWMNSRNMAKFGQLFLKKGMWGTNRVVSEDWVTNSVTTHFTGGWGPYGYMWWPVGTGGVFATHGMKGQNVYIVPDKNLVVVFTANLPSGSADGTLNSYVLNEIIPAVTN